MKGETEVGLIVVSFIAGAMLMAYSEELSMLPYMGAVIGSVATLAAAFFGANYAFKLQLANLNKREIKKQVEAGNKAIFELIRTYNQFIAVRNQFIDEHREHPGRHLLILPMAGSIHNLQLSFDSLAFIFDTKDPNLLGRLSMFQQDVASTIDVIAQRSQFHVEIIQPTVEKLGKQHGKEIPFDKIDTALGVRLLKQVKMLTHFMVTGVDDAISSAEIHIDEMNKVLKAKFPGHKILEMLKPNINKQPTLKNNETDE